MIDPIRPEDYDLVRVVGGDLDYEMLDLVMISLFTDARAEPGDALPEGSPRGGWAGGVVGSRLWTLEHRPLTDATVSDAKLFSEQALAWLVDEGIVEEVVVEATRTAQGAVLSVVLKRPDTPDFDARFAGLWRDRG